MMKPDLQAQLDEFMSDKEGWSKKLSRYKPAHNKSFIEYWDGEKGIINISSRSNYIYYYDIRFESIEDFIKQFNEDLGMQDNTKQHEPTLREKVDEFMADQKDWRKDYSGASGWRYKGDINIEDFEVYVADADTIHYIIKEGGASGFRDPKYFHTFEDFKQQFNKDWGMQDNEEQEKPDLKAQLAEFMSDKKDWHYNSQEGFCWWGYAGDEDVETKVHVVIECGFFYEHSNYMDIFYYSTIEAFTRKFHEDFGMQDNEEPYTYFLFNKFMSTQEGWRRKPSAFFMSCWCNGEGTEACMQSEGSPINYKDKAGYAIEDFIEQFEKDWGTQKQDKPDVPLFKNEVTYAPFNRLIEKWDKEMKMLSHDIEVMKEGLKAKMDMRDELVTAINKQKDDDKN